MASKRLSEVLVSIGMPVFNSEDTIEGALDSLLAQTYQNFELIISDDASSDSTGEICRRYQDSDPRIKYIRNEKNIGELANFNQVLRMGQGTFFMWAAHDDLWETDFIKELVALLEDNPSAVLAFCQFDYMDVISGNSYNCASMLTFAKPKTAFRRTAKYLLLPDVSGRAVMMYGLMRKPVIDSVGVYDRLGGVPPWSWDNHTVLLMGLYGEYAICDRVLFHKRYVAVRDLEEIRKQLPTPGDICRGNQAYKRDIADSSLKAFQKLLLRSVNMVNYIRSLAGNLLEKTFITLQGVRWIKRLYDVFPH